MKIPISTYRLQLYKDFTFKKVNEIIFYLKELGITDIYFSPITQAEKNSTHGYNVVNYNQINQELGGEADFYDTSILLKRNNLGLLLDIVPNHMATSSDNVWWKDVLENKQNSIYADFFDINWDLSTEQLSYRRFFDISELVCMNIQKKQVFDHTHALLKKLVLQNYIDSLRIDHIDGLVKPASYLDKLEKSFGGSHFTIIEKILARRETLPRGWPIQGTTGYDFLNEVNQIFILPVGLDHLLTSYHHFVKNISTVAEIRYQCNKLVLSLLFEKEFNYLLKLLNDLALMFNSSISASELTLAFSEFLINIPVYRTYIDSKNISLEDKNIILFTAEKAISTNSTISKQALDFITDIILLRLPFKTAEDFKKTLHFIHRWQVFTGPLIAKGFEDTTCYIYTPLLSLNEVGSDPNFFETVGDLSLFHTYNARKQLTFPFSLNATSTHDTKRSEDFRARLNVLSELYEDWSFARCQWQSWNHCHKIDVNGMMAPNENEENLIYQSLLGGWPLDDDQIEKFKNRFLTFLTKALREAKVNSKWAAPNQNYEEEVLRFTQNILSDPTSLFFQSFKKIQAKIAFYGMLNSLAQTILKITAPGIPDFYQGNEVWRFDLVDPDNRQLINFLEISRKLTDIKNNKNFNNSIKFVELLSHWKDGSIKLAIIYKLLQLRNQYPSLFLNGSYIPLEVSGPLAMHLIAFARRYQNKVLVVVVLRWFTSLLNLEQYTFSPLLWENTEIILPSEFPLTWQNVWNLNPTPLKIHPTETMSLRASLLLKDFIAWIGLGSA